MRRTGGEIVTRALADEGVPFTFGIPGTHNIELYDALSDSDTVRPVLVTDEQSASFMADGVWRASGALGCVNVVPGAGLTHALSGIAEAFMDNVPMLVLACGVRRDTGAAFQLHDVDQVAIAAPVTKAQLQPETGRELYAAIREACRIARAGPPGPALVEVPANLYLLAQEVDPDGETAAEDPTPSAVVDRPVPDAGALDRAAALLGQAERPLLYVGLGAAGAGHRLVALAERLEAPVATTFQGKGVFPESHPLALWPGLGRAAPPFVRRIVRDRDALLAVGCKFGEVATASYGVDPPRPLIHVDIDPDVPGRNFPTDLAVTADAAAFVEGLLGRVETRAEDGPLRRAIAEGHEDVWQDWLAMTGGERVTPAQLLRTAQTVFGDDAIFTTDSGNGTFLAMECLRLNAPGRFLAPVDYSCMGYAVPAALGAKLARPDSPVIALAGDGAFLMTGLELLTAAREAIGAVVLVLRDHELAQIAQFQQTALNRKTASEVPDYALEHLCRGLGVDFLALDSDDDVERVLRRAAGLAADGRPVVVDVAIDYSEKTYFTRGVVKTNLLRLPWRDRLRFIGRALRRRVLAR